MLQSAEQLQLVREDLLWAGLSFPVLNEEELARQHAAVEERVHFHRGVWWRRAGPCFFFPSFALAEVDHRESWPHPVRALAGFTHLSSPNSPCNGVYRALVREDVTKYSLASLSQYRRHNVRRALARLTVRVLENLHDLIEDGYEVYLSCHRRIQWGTDRGDRQAFGRWITKAFKQPKDFILGAYKEDKLVAFMFTNVVERVASVCYVASHSGFLKCFPNDALFHAFLCIARQTRGVETAWFGPISTDRSLDQFKLHYTSIKQFPSYTWINPLVRPLFNRWIRPKYPWLHGQAAQSSVDSENPPKGQLRECQESSE